MPNIIPSEHLCNRYYEVSDFCYFCMEPVFITKNGHVDLVIMSNEVYEIFCGRYGLYHLLDEATEAEKAGDFMEYDKFLALLQKEMA